MSDYPYLRYGKVYDGRYYLIIDVPEDNYEVTVIAKLVGNKLSIPFAVSIPSMGDIDWGDEESSGAPNNAQKYIPYTHTYAKSGTYIISIDYGGITEAPQSYERTTDLSDGVNPVISPISCLKGLVISGASREFLERKGDSWYTSCKSIGTIKTNSLCNAINLEYIVMPWYEVQFEENSIVNTPKLKITFPVQTSQSGESTGGVTEN